MRTTPTVSHGIARVKLERVLTCNRSALYEDALEEVELNLVNGLALNPNEPSLKRVSIELEPALMRYGSCKLNGTNLEMT